MTAITLRTSTSPWRHPRCPPPRRPEPELRRVARLAVARRRDRRREGHPHPRERRGAALLAPSSSASSTSARSRRARTCRASRRSSTRRSARSCSARRLQAETLAPHIAERVRERQDGLRAEVTIEARYPEHKPAPVSGIDDAGALHAARHRRRRRARHAPAGRRRGAGHDRLPVRPGARRRRVARAAASSDGFTDDEIERIFEAVPVATHNQRGHRHAATSAARRSCDDRHRRRDAARASSRSR